MAGHPCQATGGHSLRMAVGKSRRDRACWTSPPQTPSLRTDGKYLLFKPHAVVFCCGSSRRLVQMCNVRGPRWAAGRNEARWERELMAVTPRHGKW